MLDVHGTSRLLSPREIEILQHTADGESNAEIGDRLSLSSLTIKSHLSRIGRRLGSGDRAQLVLLDPAQRRDPMTPGQPRRAREARR